MNQNELDFNSHSFHREEKNHNNNKNDGASIFRPAHSWGENKNNQKNLFSYVNKSYELNNQNHYNIKGRTNDVHEQTSPNEVNNDFQFSYDNKNYTELIITIIKIKIILIIKIFLILIIFFQKRKIILLMMIKIIIII